MVTVLWERGLALRLMAKFYGMLRGLLFRFNHPQNHFNFNPFIFVLRFNEDVRQVVN